MASSYKVTNMTLKFVSQNKDFRNTNGICELCKKTLLNDKVVVGKCHHAFHEKCLSVNKSLSCPIDNTYWNIDYVTGTNM